MTVKAERCKNLIMILTQSETLVKIGVRNETNKLLVLLATCDTLF